MTLRRLLLKPMFDRVQLLQLEGARPEPTHFDTLVDDDADAYDAVSGRLIFRFRKAVISDARGALARDAFGDVDERLRLSYYRRSAAGRIDLTRIQAVRPDVVRIDEITADGFAGYVVVASGKRLRDPISNPVKSYMAGFNYDRYRKLGVPTGFTARFPESWQCAVPFFDAIGDAFREAMPDVAEHMYGWCTTHRVSPYYTIGSTCFSTVAVNVNYDSCYHFDRGDLPSGYSTLTAVEVGGKYAGGHLVLPQYGVAIDVRDGDLLTNQSHLDLHGNLAVEPLVSGAKRVSFVTYLKKKLMHATNKADDAT